MSRFEKLEFGSGPEALSTHRSPSARDAGFCLEEGRNAFADADFQLALRWFGRVLEYDAQCIPAWLGQVQSLIEAGNFKEANVWADKALERFPEAPGLLAAKAVALARMGRVNDAMPFSDAATERGLNDPYVWLARGDVLLAARRREVQDCFNRATQLAPGDWWIHWMMGRVYLFWQRVAPALKSGRDAAALAPERFVVWLLCGQCQAQLGLRTAAEQAFHQTLALRPDCQPANTGLQALQNGSPLGRAWSRVRALWTD